MVHANVHETFSGVSATEAAPSGAREGTIITAALATKGVSAVGRSIEGVRHALFASDTVKDESGN